MIVLVGLPGSGKSTWAAAQKKTVLSSDAVRLMLSDDERNQAIHARVFATMRYLLRQRLELGARMTILDATHLQRKWRRPWILLAARYGARVEAVYFDTPVEECLKRNAGRVRKVPVAAIRKMAAALEPPMEQEGFARVSRGRAARTRTEAR